MGPFQAKNGVVRLLFGRFRGFRRPPQAPEGPPRRGFDLERERAMARPEFEELEQPDPELLMRPVAPPWEPMPGRAAFVHRDGGRWFARNEESAGS